MDDGRIIFIRWGSFPNTNESRSAKQFLSLLMCSLVYLSAASLTSHLLFLLTAWSVTGVLLEDWLKMRTRFQWLVSSWKHLGRSSKHSNRVIHTTMANVSFSGVYPWALYSFAVPDRKDWFRLLVDKSIYSFISWDFESRLKYWSSGGQMCLWIDKEMFLGMDVVMKAHLAGSFWLP